MPVRAGVKGVPAFVRLLFDSRGPTIHRALLDLKIRLHRSDRDVNLKPLLMKIMRKLIPKSIAKQTGSQYPAHPQQTPACAGNPQLLSASCSLTMICARP